MTQVNDFLTKLAVLSVAFCVAFLMLYTPSPVLAAEMVLETKVDTITESIDKNGHPYIRIIIQEAREIQGNNYVVGVPVMCFRDTVAKARELSPGDSFKAVVQPREFQGRSSYTLLKWLN